MHDLVFLHKESGCLGVSRVWDDAGGFGGDLWGLLSSIYRFEWLILRLVDGMTSRVYRSFRGVGLSQGEGGIGFCLVACGCSLGDDCLA